MKFVMTQSVCKEGLEMIGSKNIVYVANDPDPNNYLEEMRDADALIVRIAKCDGNTIRESEKLKVIGRTGVGYDSVDLDAATIRGIPVVITPGANSRSVAEHAVAMMFSLSKNLFQGQLDTKEGMFDEARSNGRSFELLGKKVGFVGLGAIGIETQQICKALGMKTMAFDPNVSKSSMENHGCEYAETLEQILMGSDIVSLHLPLTANTKNIIGSDMLKTMKKSGILINCARGGIIDEEALYHALENDVIAGAGLDVFAQEPPQKGQKLLNAKNLIYSPHSAAQTREAVINMAEMCVEGCLAVLAGEKWPYVANPEAYNHPRWHDLGQWEK